MENKKKSIEAAYRYSMATSSMLSATPASTRNAPVKPYVSNSSCRHRHGHVRSTSILVLGFK